MKREEKKVEPFENDDERKSSGKRALLFVLGLGVLCMVILAVIMWPKFSPPGVNPDPQQEEQEETQPETQEETQPETDGETEPEDGTVPDDGGTVPDDGGTVPDDDGTEPDDGGGHGRLPGRTPPSLDIPAFPAPQTPAPASDVVTPGKSGEGEPAADLVGNGVGSTEPAADLIGGEQTVPNPAPDLLNGYRESAVSMMKEMEGLKSKASEISSSVKGLESNDSETSARISKAKSASSKWESYNGTMNRLNKAIQNASEPAVAESKLHELQENLWQIQAAVAAAETAANTAKANVSAEWEALHSRLRNAQKALNSKDLMSRADAAAGKVEFLESKDKGTNALIRQAAAAPETLAEARRSLANLDLSKLSITTALKRVKSAESTVGEIQAAVAAAETAANTAKTNVSAEWQELYKRFNTARNEVSSRELSDRAKAVVSEVAGLVSNDEATMAKISGLGSITGRIGDYVYAMDLLKAEVESADKLDLLIQAVSKAEAKVEALKSEVKKAESEAEACVQSVQKEWGKLNARMEAAWKNVQEVQREAPGIVSGVEGLESNSTETSFKLKQARAVVNNTRGGIAKATELHSQYSTSDIHLALQQVEQMESRVTSLLSEFNRDKQAGVDAKKEVQAEWASLRTRASTANSSANKYLRDVEATYDSIKTVNVPAYVAEHYPPDEIVAVCKVETKRDSVTVGSLYEQFQKTTSIAEALRMVEEMESKTYSIKMNVEDSERITAEWISYAIEHQVIRVDKTSTQYIIWGKNASNEMVQLAVIPICVAVFLTATALVLTAA